MEFTVDEAIAVLREAVAALREAIEWISDVDQEELKRMTTWPFKLLQGISIAERLTAALHDGSLYGNEELPVGMLRRRQKSDHWCNTETFTLTKNNIILDIPVEFIYIDISLSFFVDFFLR